MQDPKQLLAMTATITAGYLRRNKISSAEVPEVIKVVHAGLMAVGNPPPKKSDVLVPAVPIKRSVTEDYIVCLEDGKKLKMLKRHLHAVYNMTPDEYRARWGLPPEYPVVAPSYAAKRSAFAKKIGLGWATRKGLSKKRAR